MMLKTKLPANLKQADFCRAAICDRYSEVAAALVRELRGRVPDARLTIALPRGLSPRDFQRPQVVSGNPELAAELLGQLLEANKKPLAGS